MLGLLVAYLFIWSELKMKRYLLCASLDHIKVFSVRMMWDSILSANFMLLTWFITSLESWYSRYISAEQVSIPSCRPFAIFWLSIQISLSAVLISLFLLCFNTSRFIYSTESKFHWGINFNSTFSGEESKFYWSIKIKF